MKLRLMVFGLALVLGACGPGTPGAPDAGPSGTMDGGPSDMGQIEPPPKPPTAMTGQVIFSGAGGGTMRSDAHRVTLSVGAATARGENSSLKYRFVLKRGAR